MQDNHAGQLITIPLTRGYTASVDSEDADLAAFSWRAEISKSGIVYAVRTIKDADGARRGVKLHRIILARMLGREPQQHELTDHIDCDGLNCRRSNLRVASRVQNAANQRMSSNNTSGCKGVIWNRARNKWHVQIGVNGKRVYLGLYHDLAAAQRAYVDAAKEYFGEYANSGESR